MLAETIKVLAVDDNMVNLEIICCTLPTKEYKVVCAKSGEEALKLLQKKLFDIVLLDRKMPGIGGLETLKRIKQTPTLNDIPVIFQTARSQSNEIIEGINAGAFYYLTKPFHKEMLLSIVRAASADIRQRRISSKEAQNNWINYGMMDSCKLKIKTLEEARVTALYLSHLYPEPEKVLFGIQELIINAIEHGNLDIGYAKKSDLIEKGNWAKEIAKRQKLPENKNKFVDINYQSECENITLMIKDCGNGFDWKEYMEISPDRVSDNHGRGIALTALSCFDKMHYSGCGNEVICQTEVNIGFLEKTG